MWTLCPHNPPNLERGARRGRFRLPPNERRRLLARFTCDHGADWPLDWRVNAVGEGLPSPTSHSNRSLRTEVSVAGKRNFQGRDKEAETALEIQGRRCRDKISLGNSANSGRIAGFREISVRTRMRGGAERTRTACQARSRYRNRSLASESAATILRSNVAERQHYPERTGIRAPLERHCALISGARGAPRSCPAGCIAEVGLR